MMEARPLAVSFFDIPFQSFAFANSDASSCLAVRSPGHGPSGRRLGWFDLDGAAHGTGVVGCWGAWHNSQIPKKGLMFLLPVPDPCAPVGLS